MDQINLKEMVSAEDYAKVVEDYYSGLTVAQIKEKYDLPSEIRSIYKLLPDTELENSICIYCDEFMFGKYPKKEESQGYFVDVHCKSWFHRESGFCNCIHCKKIRQLEKDEQERIKREELPGLVAVDIDIIQFEDLNLKDKLMIGSLLRDNSFEDLDVIKPVVGSVYKFGPTEDYSEESLKYLFRKRRLLVLDPYSNPEAFTDIDLKKQTYRFYPSLVNYRLNIEPADNMSYLEMCDSIMNPEFLDQKDTEEALKLWKEIAYYECLEYYINTVEKLFNKSPKVGPKTRMMIQDLLKDYSTSQVYGIIFSASKNVTRYQKENNLPDYRAVNMMVGSARDYGERAIANNWTIPNYHRIKTLPQSSLSKFLYSRILGIGDKGFYEKPTSKLFREFQDTNESLHHEQQSELSKKTNSAIEEE